MTSASTFPAAVLMQHLAILGKTGAGKSHTARLAIEEVVGQGARVCILDPIKSDWWGLTSNRAGTAPGLPFRILGGPHGHVPLHASAGKAVAEVVASGALPLSIVDMAEFEPGGQARFFVDFAQVLLRKMRGVVYLVLEEAHLFAPKERSGIGQENLAIHWAKTLATAGRSKGIRLVLVTQRTQALHNALLGSCDTVIAHRLTAPADQAPVVQWLKANTSKTVLEQVASSLSSLKTGEGWLCSGEARIFARTVFPAIATYDNSKTPHTSDQAVTVTTAPVDAEQLRTLIGDAVEQAKQDDPKELRRTVAQLRTELAARDRRIQGLEAAATTPAAPTAAALTEDDRALLRDVATRVDQARQQFESNGAYDIQDLTTSIDALLTQFRVDMLDELRGRREAFAAVLQQPGLQQVLAHLQAIAAPSAPARPTAAAAPLRTTSAAPAEPWAPTSAGPSGELSKGELTVLTCVAQYPDGATREQISILTGYKRSTRDLYLQKLQRLGAVDTVGSHLRATANGVRLLGPRFTPLPTGHALVEHWRARLAAGERAVFDILVEASGKPVSRDVISETTGYKRSTRDLYIQQLQRRRLAVGDRSGVRAAAELFA